MSSGSYKWFTPGEGIAREVIQADICRYLGRDALVKPGYNDQGVHGYWIAAYRNLTSQMIEDLRRDSSQWYAQGRRGAYEDSEIHKRRQGITTQASTPSSSDASYPHSRGGDHRVDLRYQQQQQAAAQAQAQAQYYGQSQQSAYYGHGQAPSSQYGSTHYQNPPISSPGTEYTTYGTAAPQPSGGRDPRTVQPYGQPAQPPAQDPRYASDPRYAADPRYATDPRYASDPRVAAYYAQYGMQPPQQDSYTPSSQQPQYDQYGRPLRR